MPEFDTPVDKLGDTHSELGAVFEPSPDETGLDQPDDYPELIASDHVDWSYDEQTTDQAAEPSAEGTESAPPPPITLPTVDPEVTLRQFTSEDVDSVFQLVNEGRQGGRPDIEMERFGQHLHKTHSTPDATRTHIVSAPERRILDLGIWDKGELAGGVLLEPNNSRPTGDTVQYWVAEGHRGRGLAGTAVAAAVDYAFKERGSSAVYAGVSPKNSASLKVIARLGFTPVPNNPHWYELKPPADTEPIEP